MDDYALVLNAGSSSLKFCVFQRPDRGIWRLEARGQIEGIGTSPRLSVKDAEGTRLTNDKLDASVRGGRDAIGALSVWLKSKYGGARVLGVGHRVVHGGARFIWPTVLNQEVLAQLRDLVPLAPLHQPYNLAAIEAVFDRLPGVPQVACFDTSFHRGHEAVADLIPLPREICKDGLQRYGFHGLSYEYIASALPDVAPEIAQGKVIVAHLGSGASLCALNNGKSVDTTMGFTAVDGLCMGTRPGALDPGVVLYLFQNRGLSPKKWKQFFIRNPDCWRFPESATTCATCSTGQSRRRGSQSTTLSIGSQKRLERLQPHSAALMDLCLLPVLARTRLRYDAVSAKLRTGWALRSTMTRTTKRRRASRHGKAKFQFG